MKLTDAQFTMIVKIAEYGYIPVSLSDLLNSDYQYLVDNGYVLQYTGMEASLRCHLSDKGKAQAGI